jgi:hypothetical protein
VAVAVAVAVVVVVVAAKYLKEVATIWGPIAWM